MGLLQRGYFYFKTQFCTQVQF